MEAVRPCLVLCFWLIGIVGYSSDFVPVYQSAGAVYGKDIPGLNLRTPELAGYCAVQFGPGPKDILWLVFDCKVKMQPYDSMSVYVADHEVYGKPLLLKGKKNNGRLSFKMIELATEFGDIEVVYNVVFNVRTLWDKGQIDLKYEITCRARNKVTKKAYRFALCGDLDPIMNALCEYDVKRFIERPFLKVTWDHRSDPPYLRCGIRAGASVLVPLSGLASRADVSIAVKDEKRAVVRKTFRIEPSGSRKEFVYKPRKRFKPRTYYIAVVTVDLSPLFDVLKGESVMVLR